ncbi:MAG: peptide ABC transporter substrate-binding protein [Opitutaceae bacterium]
MRLTRSPLAVSALLALVLLTGCAKQTPSPLSASAAPTPGKVAAQVLRISQRNEPADLDPAIASLPDELFIIRALSEGLVAPSPDNAPPHPAAAESWELSSDGLTYTFHLRHDAHWSNGVLVSSSDFIASYRRVLTPATAAPKAPLLFMVKNARAYASGELTDFAQVGFHAPDAQTLVVTLEHPMPRFLAYVASGPWIPVYLPVVEKFGRYWTRPEHFVGNGAFTLAEWRPHQRIVVKKNPTYHNAAHIRLDEIQFIAFDNGDAEERAFRAGQLDVTMAIPVSKLDAYRAEQSAEAHHAPLAETRYLAFNTTKAPLNDVRVRRALSLALDRRKIVERVMRGGQEPAHRLVPFALREPADHDLPLTDDPAEESAIARQLLAEAGFPGGRGFPRLELSSWPVSTSVTEAIQAMWKKALGIDVTLVTREARVHVAALRDGRYDIGFITAIPDVADAANLLGDFVTDSPGNYPHWSDARYDALVAQAIAAPTAAQQAGLLREAETRLLGECPLAPVYFNATNWLMRPTVQGWHQDPLWTRFYQDVFLREK